MDQDQLRRTRNRATMALTTGRRDDREFSTPPNENLEHSKTGSLAEKK